MAGAVCQVTGVICGVDGSAKEGAQVRATVKETIDNGGQVVGSSGVTSETISAITQTDGTFSIQLLQGATVLLEIPDINLRKEVVIPAETSVDFTTLV